VLIFRALPDLGTPPQSLAFLTVESRILMEMVSPMIMKLAN
jgi:hypothetical protein